MPAHWKDLGLITYKKAYELQTELVEKCRQDQENSWFLILEHKPVFTLGRNGGQQNLCASAEFLQQQKIDLHYIERGGDITYHGPGQIILYPIFSLRHKRLGVSDYVHHLEEIMLRTATDFGISANRDQRNHGIWVANEKMGSIGIAIRHGITFHGLGLNINTDLNPFGWINPCGLTNTGMTSFLSQTGNRHNLQEVKQTIKEHCQSILNLEFQEL